MNFQNVFDLMNTNEVYKGLTKEQAKRKAVFMARATAHFDTPEIRQETSDMWDKANKVSWYQKLKKWL